MPYASAVLAQAALVAAVGASEEVVAGPACIVFSNGSDLASVGGSNVAWGFRVTCYVGYDNAGATVDLMALTFAKLVILRALAGWQVLGVSSDAVRSLAGGDHLTADISVAATVTLT